MNEYNVELKDTDISFVGETSNDITVDTELLGSDIENGDQFNIHYAEDPTDVIHTYEVVSVDNDTATLKWIKWNKSETLMEGNPLAKIKNKLNPSLSTRMKKAAENSKKEAARVEKRGEKLVARDMSAKGRSWSFYLQKEDGSYTEPMTQTEAKKYYDKMGNKLTPNVANAIVVDSNNNIVRRGLEDTMGVGIELAPSEFRVSPTYSILWPEQDTTLTTNNKATADNKSSTQDSAENSAQASSNSRVYISKSMLDKFRKLAGITGIVVKDAEGREVDINNINTRNVTTYTVSANGKTTGLGKWLRYAAKEGILTEDLMVESPVITLDDSDLTDPDNVDFKGLIHRAEEREAAKVAADNKREQVENLKNKYHAVEAKFKELLRMRHSTLDILEVLFDQLVPAQGPADTVAGEHVRAIMRLLYRDYNDGDKFFEGYGLETCASSAEYLFDNSFAEQITNILERAYQLSSDDAAYTSALVNLASAVIEKIQNNIDLMYAPNDVDSRDYSYDYIKENQPRYEFELYASDDVETLVEKGVLDAWDLNHYVEHQLEYDSRYTDAEVSRPWSHNSTTVTIENLTKDGYEAIESNFTRDPEGFWEDLTSEHAEDLDTDDDYDDDYDSEA